MKRLTPHSPAVLEHGVFLPAEFCQRLEFALRRKYETSWPTIPCDEEALKKFREALHEAAAVL